MVYKKNFIFLWVFLFSSQIYLHQIYLQASQTDLSDKDNHTARGLTMKQVQSSKNFSGKNFNGKKLPKDLSRANLTGANLAGHHFSDTNFIGAQLGGVILTDTTCDYLQCFQDNVQANKSNFGKWYLDHLPKDLQGITQVYPCLSEDHHKAELLQVACNLAHLPFYKFTEFRIKIEYWSCKLFILKKQLGSLGTSLVCSLGSNLNSEAANYCWQTDYPAHLEHHKGMQIASRWCMLATKKAFPKELSTLIQCHLTEPVQKFHANFDRYLQLFQEGLIKYNVKSKEKWGYDHYKKTIERNIEGLKKAYAKLTSEKLRKEAIEIAHELSEKYKNQHLLFLLGFLSCQNRLIKLRISAGVNEGVDIHYNIAFSAF